VARDVPQPRTNKSVWEALRDRSIERARTDEDKKELRERVDLRIAALDRGQTTRRLFSIWA
jgi:hypothetical protein